MSSLSISYFPAGNAAEGRGTSVQPAGSGSSSRDKGSGCKFAGFLPFLAVLRFFWVFWVSQDLKTYVTSVLPMSK